MASAIDYQPLNSQKREVRLLVLHPAADLHFPSECELFIKSLDQAPPPRYNALSYVWGDTGAEALVKLNGREVRVGLSLATALRYMRKAEDDIVIWADAICINQSDLEERNEQVVMMGQIYRGAEKVLAWLGEHDENSTKAMDFIEHWGRFSTDPKISAIASQMSIHDWPKWAHEVSPPSFDLQYFRAFIKFAGRPYWRRTWIIQELKLARSVEFYCSERTISSSCMREATSNMNIVINMHSIQTGEMFWEEIVKSPLWNLVQFASRSTICLLGTRPGTIPKVKFDILEATRLFWSSKATNPRDHIYGMLGMTSMDPNSLHYGLLRPNYLRSVAGVYHDFARYQLLTKKSLLPLRYCRGPGNRSSLAETECLPSWVPDMSNFEEAWIHEFEDGQSLRVDDFDHLVEIAESRAALVVKGFEVDVVKTVYQHIFPFWPESSFSFTQESINQFQRDIIKGPIVREKTSLQAFVDLMVRYGELRYNDKKNGQFGSEAGLLGSISSYVVQNDTGPDGPFEQLSTDHFFAQVYYPPDTDSRLVDELCILIATLPYRPSLDSHEERSTTLFRTNHGKFGLAPKGIQDGDVLCYLAGYRHLLALRPNHGHYVFVGEVRVTDLYLPKIVPELYPYMKEFEIH